MALPVINNVVDCADFSSTVTPYIYQLRPLPQIVFQSITSASVLKQIYLDTNPLVTSIAFSIAIAPIFLLVSEINKNYSQVDRVWSILPTIYNVHYTVYAWAAGLDTTRIGAVAIASIIWSIRLTYNYWRRGGYQIGSEDYRWEVVKEYAGPTGMFLFNVVFISLAQSILLCMATFPSYVILLLQRATYVGQLPAFTTADAISFAAMVSCVVLTAIADQQQWNYQNAKAEYRKTAKVPAGHTQEALERGFNTEGMFSYSRKPNYAFEQCHWAALYAWSCVASGTWCNWSGVGIVAYFILFQASTWITELLTAKKYPEYKTYRAQVGKFIPSSLKPATFEKSRKQVTNGSIEKDDSAVVRERYNLR